MSISAITIENFKGIKEPVRVELKPITLLFGPNSAGKSTIIQALHYAREIFERQNLNPDRTIIGGDAVDLGGFESLVHNHDLTLPIKIRFELDLQKEDLPIYHDGEVEFIGSDLLDNADSAFLMGVVSRVAHASVGVAIRWSEQLAKPYVVAYTVQANGENLIEVESSPNGKQVFISRINPFNPIFFDTEDIDKVRKKATQLLNAAAKGVSGDDPVWSDFEIGDLGDMFRPLFYYLNLEQGLPGLNRPINIEKQNSPIPVWGKNLILDRSIWAEDLDQDFGAAANFVRVLSALTVGPGELVRDWLRKICYIGPLREVPKRGHKPATSQEESRWANGLAAYDNLFFSDDTFVSKVNEWLTHENRLNSGYSVEIKKYRELEVDNPLSLALLQGKTFDEDLDLRDSLLGLPVKRRLLIRDEARNIELAPQDIGVGISQVLPVVVAALQHENGLVAIEQPELHIHPAFQVALGDLFIEQVGKCPDLSFILETHSEHLMLRFLRRIRETSEDEAPMGRALAPANLSVYFIEQGQAGISCKPIRVDKDGDFIDLWPTGFFNERAKELF
jgi:hypothetical protein